MIDNTWKKSTHCDSGTYVEVRHIDGSVQVRNSGDPDGPVLTYTPHDWKIELDVIRRCGRPFDAPEVEFDLYQWRYMGVSLWVTRAEMDAFVAGVCDNEFDLPEVDRG